MIPTLSTIFSSAALKFSFRCNVGNRNDKVTVDDAKQVRGAINRALQRLQHKH